MDNLGGGVSKAVAEEGIEGVPEAEQPALIATPMVCPRRVGPIVIQTGGSAASVEVTVEAIEAVCTGPTGTAVPVSIDWEDARFQTNDLRKPIGELPFEVQTPAQPWAYGAVLPFRLELDANFGLIQIRALVSRSRAGFGILNLGENDFIYRDFVGASEEPATIVLPIERTAEVVAQGTISQPVGAQQIRAADEPPEREGASGGVNTIHTRSNDDEFLQTKNPQGKNAVRLNAFAADGGKKRDANDVLLSGELQTQFDVVPRGKLFVSRVRILSAEQEIAALNFDKPETTANMLLVYEASRGDWGPLVRQEGRQTRQYMRYGSIFHKLPFMTECARFDGAGPELMAKVDYWTDTPEKLNVVYLRGLDRQEFKTRRA